MKRTTALLLASALTAFIVVTVTVVGAMAGFFGERSASRGADSFDVVAQEVDPQVVALQNQLADLRQQMTEREQVYQDRLAEAQRVREEREQAYLDQLNKLQDRIKEQNNQVAGYKAQITQFQQREQVFQQKLTEAYDAMKQLDATYRAQLEQANAQLQQFYAQYQSQGGGGGDGGDQVRDAGQQQGSHHGDRDHEGHDDDHDGHGEHDDD